MSEEYEFGLLAVGEEPSCSLKSSFATRAPRDPPAVVRMMSLVFFPATLYFFKDEQRANERKV